MPIKIIRQDITKIKCDAIVNPTDVHYSHGGGVDAAIHEAAGDELYCACVEQGTLDVGKAVITSAFLALPCNYVIHTVGPQWRGGEYGEETLLRSCYSEVLKLALANKCESIAIPLIASGTFGFPKDKVLKIAVDEISNFLLENEMLVYIVVFDKTSYSISEKLFFDVTSFIKDTYVERRSIFDSEQYCKRVEPSHKENIRDRAADACELPKAADVERRPIFKPSPHCRRMEPLHKEAIRNGAADACEVPEIARLKPPKDPPKVSLEDMLGELDKGFADTLFYYIDKKGLTDVECYKRANVDKKTFSKIKCNKDYRPSKVTVVSFAIALRLDIEETRHLLNTVGMSLSHSSVFDVIIEYFVTTGNYRDIFDVNETLYKFDQITLGV